jgi:hypothetical protein
MRSIVRLECTFGRVSTGQQDNFGEAAHGGFDARQLLKISVEVFSEAKLEVFK